ncbi:ATPase-like protein [Halorhabdus tiamatea SARL4B]|uniref:ATPase-like protein n=1 Tax=Halorhabdus tiamatea SARL4B TaxID=1033806 RepID=F7PHU7_9EURY|nr:ATP-binding protein [Halorhabdus tiamatea]ERJ06941.1 ATPase-like protein [Halorhabdus tiamatea SARL4B]CCQ32358.1 bipolar DNA helicase [Halorhabdus tiamatea SARL4B]
MTFVLGRGDADDDLPKMRLGTYRALDGSPGADLFLDLDRPHAMLVVGKRGYGKSYTLGVLAEGLAATPGIAPTIVDPMGIFGPLAGGSNGESNRDLGGDAIAATVFEEPTVAPDTLDPRSWCALLGLDPESGAGSLVWRAAQERSTLAGMRKHITDGDAPDRDERAALNHLRLAQSWGVFDAEGIDAEQLGGGEITVVDVSGHETAAMSAVCRGVGEALYRAGVSDSVDRLPWLLVDEAHTFFDGVAASALETILTRGRAPGVSLVSATQRPSAVPEVGVSQSDVLLSHRLTAGADLDALRRAQPTYMNGSLADRMPSQPGDVVIVDDATETVHAARVRERETPHGGDSPAVSETSYGQSIERNGRPEHVDVRPE